MKSRITIDFADAKSIGGLHKFEPVIKVDLQGSEDVRDKLIKEYFQQLGHQSSWLKVDFKYHGQDPDIITEIFITPIRPWEIESTIDLMKERISGNPVKS